ncbi:MAG TPA: flavodoxin family protein, partial [Anaerolineaceae bacterium]|nr:flavodoxin family protein [Anaerolineaceae bacterium]
MKTLTLIGSQRKNGNTAQAVQLILDELNALAERHQVPFENETVFLSDLQIGYCRGCRACFDRGEAFCPVHDDFPALKAKLRAADAVIVASPVYIADVSGQVKTWMDRMAHVNHRPEFAGKCAYAVTTVGSYPSKHSLDTLLTALRAWGFYVAGKSEFIMGARMQPEETRARFGAQAKRAAASLFSAVHERKFARPSLVGLIYFSMQQRFWQQTTDRDTIDYRYWHERGWVDPACSYYFPHKAGPIKVALARGLAAII